MKKILLFTLLWMSFSTLIAQDTVFISGHITDITNGNPIINQEVVIQSDSSSGTGFIYYNVVYTNSNGVYYDFVSLSSPSDSGLIIITTIDCQGIPHTGSHFFSPGNHDIYQNFQICTPPPCQAAFTYIQTNGYTVEFTDASTGTTGPWSWLFGDGSILFQQNPSHTYTSPGYYTVILYIGSTSSSCFDSAVQIIQVIDSTAGPCTASFVANQDSIPPNTVSFTDQSTGYILDWFWEFGDGQTAWGQNQVHTYAEPGLYNVCLMVLGWDTLCFDTFCMLVQVSSNPGGCQADFTYYPDSASNPQTIQFLDLSTGNPEYWFWEFGDGTSSFEQNPVHYFQSPGFYNVCLTIQSNDSLCYDIHCELVAVLDSASCQAQFSYYPDSTSGNYSLQFIDLSSGDPTGWFWDFGDSTSSTEQNPVHIFPESGTYYVCLTITGLNCTSTWCENVEVGNDSNCMNYFLYETAGLSVNFEGFILNQLPASYIWNFGDGQIAQGQSVIHTYTASGIYYVSLFTEDTTGCTYSSGQTVVVGDTANFHQVYGQVFAGNFPLEEGTAMIYSIDTNSNFLPFIDIRSIDSAGVYYFPMVPEGNFVIYAIPADSAGGYLPTYYGDVIYWEQATVVSLGQPSNPYDIHLAESDWLISGIGTINGQINTGVKSTLVDKITMLLLNEQGQPISFSRVTTEGAFEFPPVDYGLYWVYAEMPGCTSDHIKVMITPEEPDAEITLTFQGGRILGITDSNPLVESILVYPNPVTNDAAIRIKLSEASSLTFELYNVTGQSVYQHQQIIPAGESTINLPMSTCKTGLYTLRMFSAEGVNITRKLLKSR